MDAFEQARRALPNVPEEVFRLWLDDRIRSNGWPPSGIEWEGFLFGRSLEQWQRLNWKRMTMALTPQDLGSKSIDLAIQMVEANIHGKSNLLSAYIPNTKQRFDSIRRYIDAESRLPAPLVLLKTSEGYEVAEGNHRIGAMLAAAGKRGVSGFFPTEVDVWVGDIDA